MPWKPEQLFEIISETSMEWDEEDDDVIELIEWTSKRVIYNPYGSWEKRLIAGHPERSVLYPGSRGGDG